MSVRSLARRSRAVAATISAFLLLALNTPPAYQLPSAPEAALATAH